MFGLRQRLPLAARFELAELGKLDDMSLKLKRRTANTNRLFYGCSSYLVEIVDLDLVCYANQL